MKWNRLLRTILVSPLRSALDESFSRIAEQASSRKAGPLRPLHHQRSFDHSFRLSSFHGDASRPFFFPFRITPVRNVRTPSVPKDEQVFRRLFRQRAID